MTESNRRHSACKADALPTELITLCRLTEAELNQNSGVDASVLSAFWVEIVQYAVFKGNYVCLNECHKTAALKPSLSRRR